MLKPLDAKTRHRLFYGAALLAVLMIEGDLPAREDGVKKAKAVVAAAAKQEVPDDAWSTQMKSRLGPFDSSAVALEALSALSSSSLLDAQTADLPDGEIWRKTWQLKQLGELLAAPKPNVAAIQTTAKALAAPGPVALEPARRTLVYLTAKWIGMAGATPQSAARERENIAVLLRAAHRKSPALAAREEDTVRAAFRELAALRRFDDLLAEYRAEHSGFNYRTQMTDDYIEQQSRRQFEVPVAFPTTAGGIQIQVRGTAVADATVEVVPNATQGELRVDVVSVGRFGVSGSKGKMHLSANSTQRLTSTQRMYLDPLAINTPGPKVCDRSCTSLNWLQVCTRLPIVGRVVAKIARPIAARKLAEQDPVIARKVEDQVRERVAEEGFDIAYRINGRFGAIGSEIFPADGDKPRVAIQSTADHITWSALYADADELGALSPPPADSAEYDVRHWTHESAADNWGTRLNGKYLDEATFLNLLKEDLNLFSKEFDAQSPLRTPAVLLFAANEPLTVRFREQAVELTLRLQGYGIGRAANWHAARTVKLRYRVVVDAKGMRLVRDREDYLKDKAWKEALDHFLPAVLEPIPRFQNANLKSRLSMQMLSIADGWLATGANRVVESSAAPDLAKD